MWKNRKAINYFGSENIEGRSRECISIDTVKGFLERLSLAEEWLLKNLLGNNYAVRAAAANVKVFAKTESTKMYFGDLYVVQNVKNKKVSFKLYCPKENRFIWSVDTDTELKGYMDLKCNTHLLHLGDSIYIFKFPDKRERNFSETISINFCFLRKPKSK